MRAVVDTNVLVRATKNATRPARELLRCFDSDEHVLVLSNAILSEALTDVELLERLREHDNRTA